MFKGLNSSLEPNFDNNPGGKSLVASWEKYKKGEGVCLRQWRQGMRKFDRTLSLVADKTGTSVRAGSVWGAGSGKLESNLALEPLTE